ncbi:MAG: hypothetical protein AAB774_00310 [Patescibacteria group bacterium]
MFVQDWINWLSVIVLLGFLVALVYFIIVLHRANRVVTRLDNLTGTIGGFVQEIVPAIVNMGTVVTAVQSILRQLVPDHKDEKKLKKLKK